MELSDLPYRLTRDVHAAVFGALPASLARALDTPEVAAAVTALLAAGWWPGEVGARVDALPAGKEPAVEVLALLRTLRFLQVPDRQAAARKANQQSVQQATPVAAAQHPTATSTATPTTTPMATPMASTTAAEQPASKESRERWLTQIRHELRAPRRPRPVPSVRVRRACAVCGEPGELFVTRAVRLCVPCVAGLEAGLAAGLGTSLQLGQTRLEQAG